MINFKITSLVNGNLTIESAPGKSVLLSPGETVKAEVTNVLSSGIVTLRIKGEIITAKTDVPLQQGETAFFQVSDSPSSANELRLRFIGYEETSQAAAPSENFMSTSEGQTLAGLILELSDSLPKDQNSASTLTGDRSAATQSGAATLTADKGPTAQSSEADTFPLNKVESLLKALPADINALPEETKTQLQDLLLASLRSTGQSIQSRLVTVSNQLSDTLANSPAAENFKTDIMLNMESLLSSPLKNALLNTGVVLEAKLKAEAIQMQFPAVPADTESQEQTAGPALPQDFQPKKISDLPVTPELLSGTEDVAVSDGVSVAAPAAPQDETPLVAHTDDQTSVPQVKTRDALPALKNDLKAVLLELKERLSVPPDSIRAAQDSTATAALKETAHAAALKNLQGKIEGLLKDIETFQALSKTTDSFYTFLPVNWKELKDGEVAFKKGRAGTGSDTSSSCRVNLDLDKFGTLSILVLMHKKDFFVSFKAENPETDSLLSSNLEELKSSFREKGLSLKAVHMLDKTDASMEHLEKLGSSERILSIKA